MIWVLIAGTLILLTFAVAYIVVMVMSHRRVVEAQRAKLEEVQRSEERYKSLFDNSVAGIFKFSPEDWTIVESNEAIRSLFGCRSNEELQGSILDIAGSTRGSIQRSLTASGFVSEYEIHATRRDGDELWLLFSAKITRDDNLAQAVIVDITKRKQFEEKIREQATLLDQTQDAIIVVDGHGIIEYWNSGAELMYGWSRLEAGGRALGALLYNDTQWEDFLAAMEDVRQYNEWNGEHHQRRKDGKGILVESRWKRIEKSSGQWLAILIVNSDITEKRRLESQFIRSQKMESIALLTGGMAHDLQNILAPVAMSIPLLRKKLGDESATPILNAVEESARSGLELVKNILTYGRGISGQRVKLDVVQILDQVLGIFSPGVPDSIDVRRCVNGKPCFVSGDHNQLKQVFLNLLVNARDAMPSGGVLEVAVELCEADEDLFEDFPDAETSPYVLVSVTDNGAGIPEENLDRIFEPFYTTKERGEGTGLGLSIAHGIVTSHRGYITVRSMVSQGTTFRVYLPSDSE
jgi:PAS domain S-box-containing protein